MNGWTAGEIRWMEIWRSETVWDRRPEPEEDDDEREEPEPEEEEETAKPVPADVAAVRAVRVVSCGDCGQELYRYRLGEPVPMVNHECAAQRRANRAARRRGAA